MGRNGRDARENAFAVVREGPLSTGSAPPAAPPPYDDDDAVATPAIDALHTLIQGLEAGLDLPQTMSAIAEGVVNDLEFGVAAISMVEPDGDLVVTVVAGSPEARATLLGSRSPRSEWDRMLSQASPRGPNGTLRLHEHLIVGDWDQDLVPTWVPTAPVPAAELTRAGRSAWDRLDSLFGPLFSPSGDLLAVLSVDLPPGGVQPDLELYALLELFVALAATALLHAGLHTELMAAKEAARAEVAARLQSVIDASPVAIVEVDCDGLVTEWSKSAHLLLGYRSDDVIGRPVPSRVDGSTSLAAVLDRLVHDAAPSTAELTWTRPDGRQVQLEITAGATRADDGSVRGVMALLTDVTERRRLEIEVQRRLTHDPLTGLPNRALLLDRLQALLDADPCRPVVMVVDLDRFRDINDTLGHELGDELLCAVADRLTAHLHAEEVLARIAADEFAVILLPHTDPDAAVDRCGDILTSLHQTFELHGLPVDVEASLGVATADHDGAADLLRRADIAMHEAKTHSAGLVRLTQGDIAPPSGRTRLLGELRRAVQDRELVLHYQPQLDLRTQRLCGVEALIRWQHPDRGTLVPGAFMDVAENSGLITPITTHVLDRACAQLRTWSEHGHRLQVSVNLSARNLYDRHLPARVGQVLTEFAIEPGLLRLEVTESALMHDPDRALAVLRELVHRGVSISLDDFGTGFSSLSHLRHVPAAELKIDKSFVTDMTRREADLVLVRSTIDLAHNLGLTVVAEGVEDGETLSRLGELGCDVAQGYHIARPQPADQFQARFLTVPGGAADCATEGAPADRAC